MAKTSKPIHVIIKSPSGGVWNNTSRAACAFAKGGREVALHTLWSVDPCPPLENVKTHNFLKANIPFGKLGRIFYLIYSLLRWFMREKPEIIVIKAISMAVPFIALKVIFFWREVTIAIITDMHASNHLKQSQKLIKNRSWLFKTLSKITHSATVYRWMMRHVDYMIVHTHHMADDLIKNFGLSPKKSHMLPAFIRAQFYETIMPEARPQSTFLFVGRMSDQKNIEDLLKAMQILVRDHDHIKLLMLGDGPLMALYQKLSHNLGLEKNVEFLGKQSDVEAYQAKANCVILTSHYEGVSQVVMESLANGVPVIAYNHLSGPYEFIKNGTNGFLVDPYNIQDLVDKIMQSMGHDWSPKEIRETARDFHPEKVEKAYIDFAENHLK